MLKYVICVIDEDVGVYAFAFFFFFFRIDKGTISFTPIYHYFIGVVVQVECVYVAHVVHV